MTDTLPHPATTRRAFARRLIARRRRGISLFQVLMGLALFAATLIGAVQLYNSATETQRRNDAQALLTTLTVAVSQIWQGVATYGTTNMVLDLAARGAIPSSALDESARNPRIRHPFGARVRVRGATTEYVIIFENLDDENCAMLIDPYAGQAAGSSALAGVAVGSTTIAQPMTPGGIRAACNNGVGANDVTFTFE